jgi:hypothetical protein
MHTTDSSTRGPPLRTRDLLRALSSALPSPPSAKPPVGKNDHLPWETRECLTAHFAVGGRPRQPASRHSRRFTMAATAPRADPNLDAGNAPRDLVAAEGSSGRRVGSVRNSRRLRAFLPSHSKSPRSQLASTPIAHSISSSAVSRKGDAYVHARASRRPIPMAVPVAADD